MHTRVLLLKPPAHRALTHTDSTYRVVHAKTVLSTGRETNRLTRALYRRIPNQLLITELAKLPTWYAQFRRATLTT